MNKKKIFKLIIAGFFSILCILFIIYGTISYLKYNGTIKLSMATTSSTMLLIEAIIDYIVAGVSFIIAGLVFLFAIRKKQISQ